MAEVTTEVIQKTEILPHPVLLIICPRSWQSSSMGVLMPQNCINITLLAEGIFLNFLVLGDDVFPLHASTSVSDWCSHVSSITCDNLLPRSLFFFTISLQKMLSHLYAYLFVLFHMLLGHIPCTNFVISRVIKDDGI
jgi:hypothetical protein